MPGEHNRGNALLAATVAVGVGCAAEAIRGALASFAGLPGRLEVVAEPVGRVIINDTIVLVEMVRARVAGGMALTEAIVAGAASRLRPVLLTTLTTIGGLISLLFEGSLQAQLIQPLAVTLIFGLLLSPFLVLFFVPALIGIGADIRSRLSRRPLAEEAPA